MPVTYRDFDNEEAAIAYAKSLKGEKPYGQTVAEEVFPGVKPNSTYRSPDHPLSKKNPKSYHTNSDRAIDLPAIKGMTFEQAAQKIKDSGYDILEMQDEYANPSGHATGGHWHFVVGDRKFRPFDNEEEAMKYAASLRGETPAAVATPETPQIITKASEMSPVPTARRGEIEDKTTTAITGAEEAQQNDIQAILFQNTKSSWKDVESVLAGKYPEQLKAEGRNLKWYFDHYKKGGKSPIAWTADKNRPGENVDPNEIVVEAPELGMSNMDYLQERAKQGAELGLAGGIRPYIERALTDKTDEEILDEQLTRRAEYEDTLKNHPLDDSMLGQVLGFGAEAVGGITPLDAIPIAQGSTALGRIGGSALANVVEDAAAQSLDVGSGAQDGYSIQQTAIAAAIGAGLQGAGELAFKGLKIAAGSKEIPSDDVISRYEGTGVTLNQPSKNVTEVSYENMPEIKGRTRAGSPKDVKTKSVAEAVARTTEGWTNSPKIVVYTNFGALERAEPGIAAGMKRDGATKAPGLYGEDGRIHIVSDNVKPENVQSLIFHEALGHDGLAKQFGEDLATEVSKIYDANWRTRREAGNLAMKGYGEAYASTPKSRAAVKAAMKLTNAGEKRRALEAAIETDPVLKAMLAEEVLAKQSEGGPINKTIIDRIANKIREYARKMGLKLDLSAREVRAILSEAHARVISGEPSVASATGQKYILTTHVSPHEFTNTDPENPYGKFDHSKMGTGEGAQVYGWGTYLGENTRDAYFRKFSRDLGSGAKVGDTDVREYLINEFDKDFSADSYAVANAINMVEEDISWYSQNTEDYKNSIDFVDSRINQYEWLLPEMRKNDPKAATNAEYILDAYKTLRREGGFELTGKQPKTYEVDVPDEMQKRMLLWDRPLSEQPDNVKAVAEKLGIKDTVSDLRSKAQNDLMDAEDEARAFFEENLNPIYTEKNKIEDTVYENYWKGKSREDVLKEVGETEESIKKFYGEEWLKDRMDGIAFNASRRAGDRFLDNHPNYSKIYKKNFELNQDIDFLKKMLKSYEEVTGEKLYAKIVEAEGSPKKASQFLAENGVPGNKYEDGFSRGKSGEKSYNYVMYNDEGPDAPKIINKYALPDDKKGEKIKEKFLAAMKGARRINEDYQERLTADRAEKARKVKGVQQTGEKGFYARLSALQGKTDKPIIAPLREQFSQREVNELFRAFQNDPNLTTFQSINAQVGLKKLLEGTLPTPSELDLIGRVMGRDFVKYALDLRSTPAKLKNLFREGIGFQRALISGIDLSGPFRQGWGLMSRKQFWTNLLPMLKQAGSKDFHNQVMLSIEEHPYYDLAKKSGLFLAEMGKDLNAREEAFESTWVDKTPILSHSNNAYTGFLNKLRFDTFVSLVEKYKDFSDPNLRVDLTDEANSVAAEQLAKHINQFTGRGSLGKRFESAAPLLSVPFFSPRLLASRINMLTSPARWLGMHPVARREAMKDFVNMVGITSTVIGLVKFLSSDEDDVDVELDPRSSDFGKIRIGERRYDIMGGLGQYIVLGSKLIPAMSENMFGVGTAYKKTAKGEFVRLRGTGQTGADELVKFLRNKAAPIPGYLYDSAKGKDPVGEEFDTAKDTGELFAPLFLQDFIGAWYEEGFGSAAATLPALIGFGYAKYPATPTKFDAYGRTKKESEKKDPIVEELTDLSERSGLNKPLVDLATGTNLPKAFRDIEDPKPLEMFQEVSGKYIMAELRQLVNTEEWRAMNTQEKIEAVRKAKAAARKQARDELFGEGG